MPLDYAEIQKLKRWNTPTIANALEQISSVDPLAIVNREEVRHFTPELGIVAGYAMTVVISGGDPKPKREQPRNFSLYREYLASLPGPKIVVVQDLDRPACHGSVWGEVGAANAQALGCVGTIVDGAVRDVSEMKGLGFHALARRLAVSHAHCWPLRWGVEVEVFGTRVKPGQLIHADQHGFIVVPAEAEAGLLAAARQMDDFECETVIAAGLASREGPMSERLARLDAAGAEFGRKVAAAYQSGRGEW